jgi:hypothetical protein
VTKNKKSGNDESREPSLPAGEDRRSPELPDRRKVRRGGRRAGDLFKDVAKFVHQLLTEPPR